MNQETVKPEIFTFGGETMGRLADGRAVFVPFALPGEEVRIELVEDKPRYARARLVDVLTPSEKRVEARCPHFAQCGGCHYQHLPYQEQLTIKTDILRDQLQRIGKIEDPPVKPCVASKQPWNYRNQMQFQISPEGQLGFQSQGGQAVIPISECHLPEDSINQLWPQLDLEAIPGLDRVGIRLGANQDLMVVLQSSDPHPVGLDLDTPLSVVHLGPGGGLVMAGDDHIVMEIKQRLFRVSAGSFFQTNAAMAEVMVAHLVDGLPLDENSTLIDAYCGVGLLSAFLAPHIGRLVAIEASPETCDDFAINLDEFENVELYQAPVEDVLPTLDLHPEVIVVDPPRSGLARQALDGILSLEPERLAYISSDPATLARDAKRLIQGGYQLQEVTPFDVFPQTYHIESISFLEKG
jgi:23S rRNA (uracil1939-C5)-methyltransferase